VLKGDARRGFALCFFVLLIACHSLNMEDDYCWACFWGSTYGRLCVAGQSRGRRAAGTFSFFSSSPLSICTL
jgi:hypothetical protein